MYGTKVCPRCGKKVFEDMDVCYECLFEFSSDEPVVPEEVYEDAETLAEAPIDWSEHMGLRVCTRSVEVTVPVGGSGLTIGRGMSCDVVLHGKAVSRNHARVDCSGDGVVVRDLGARNRTTVAGKRVDEPVRLRVGERFDICDSSFVVCKMGE